MNSTKNNVNSPIINHESNPINYTSTDTLNEIFVEGQPRNRANRIGGAVKGGALGSFKAVNSVFSDFKKFINKGNVVDLAVALVLGAAFTAVVTSIVTDLITPIISLAGQKQLSNNYIVLKCPIELTAQNCSSYATILAAQTNGVVTWNYGNFIQSVINFLIISLIVFFIVKLYTAAFRRDAPVQLKTKLCLECASDIPILAKKCPMCLSAIEEVMLLKAE